MIHVSPCNPLPTLPYILDLKNPPPHLLTTGI
jgi:hypothetical protein